ncbi:T9SS type A sorting domain-containing protein [Postechiella marina]
MKLYRTNFKMKVLFFVILLFSMYSNSQTVFEENFESKNNAFNLETDGYVLSKADNYTGTVTAVVRENNGNKYARMVASPNGGAKMQIVKTITVEAGKNYVYELDTKGPFKRHIRIYTLNDELISASPDYKPTTTAEEAQWKKLETTFVAGAGVTQVKIGLYHNWSGTIDIDNIKVEETIRQTAFYLSNAGDDSNKGTIDAPWKTLSRISANSLFPGDAVYFNRGDRFDGHYVVNGSGEIGNPILISAYGTGEKPIITGEVGSAGGGDYAEAILIENCDNLILEDLEIQNERLVTRSGVSDTDAFGIAIHNSSDAVMENFVFRNLTLKDVFAVQPMLEPEDFDAIQVSGIRFTCSKNTEVGKEKNIQNILIEDSYFTNLQRFGIQFKHSGGNNGVGNDAINKIKDIIVRNNEFYYNGGTAVLPNRTYNCLIENNIFDHPGATTDARMPGRGSSVWNIWSVNTVVQYNMCLSTRGYLDSYGIHIDIENENTFVQYNYMEDCEGGFVEILAGNKNAVYRFNVDVNSGFRVHDWNNASSTIYVYSDRWKEPNQAALNLCDGVYINNNTIVIDQGIKTNGDPYTTAITFDSKNTFVYNNIFSSTNGAGMGERNFAIRDNNTPFTVTNNLFEGTVNTSWVNMDKNSQIGASRFTGIGDNKKAYQVFENSLALNNGTPIQGPVLPGAGTGVFENVPAYPNVDFYGNPIDLSSGTPNIGAYNGKSNADILSNSTFNLVSKNTWLVYPSADNLKLHIGKVSGVLTSNIEVSIINLKGQMVQEESLKVIPNKREFILNVNEGLANGIYVLTIKSEGVSHSRKILLRK